MEVINDDEGREHPLIAAIKRTLADPGATRRMVLEQGKAFVYLRSRLKTHFGSCEAA